MNIYNKPIKKILCISVMQNWGGGEEFLLKLCKNLNDYEFVIASPEGNVFNEYKKNNLNLFAINSLKKIYRSPSGWRINSLLSIFFNLIYNTFRIIKTIIKENPSILLANGLFAALYVLPAVFFSRKRLIVVQHLIFNNASVEKQIINIIYKRAMKIVCVSNAVRENVFQMLKISNSEKVIVIPNGISLPDKKALTNKTSNNIHIGIVGSIIRIKGIHLIIEALKENLKNDIVFLHIFGTTANDEDSLKYAKEIKELINESDLEKNIHFEGYCESKEMIYSSMDIVINYSVVPESFSLVVLEAMSFRKIVIAINSGGPKEIINNGVNGFLVEPGNIMLLREKANYCIKNFFTDEMKVIRDNARNLVEENYSIKKFVENYTVLFTSIENKS